MENSYLQVRVNNEDKQKAAAILEQLGTNTSSVINMLLKQIIITKSIPFDIKLPKSSKKISPYKIDDLKAILSKVTDSVEEIWVFGSSVTEHCRPQSDLDICIVGNTSITEETAIYKSTKGAVDIITETPEGFAQAINTPGSVYKEVFEKGILVYKKGENIEWEKIY